MSSPQQYIMYMCSLGSRITIQMWLCREDAGEAVLYAVGGRKADPWRSHWHDSGAVQRQTTRRLVIDLRPRISQASESVM